MKKVTSMTLFTTAEGMRLSTTHSVIDESGKVVSENNRTNRIISDETILEHIQAINTYAQGIIDNA